MTADASRTWGTEMSRAYQQWLVPAVFRPFALELAARIARLHPARVLELAAGTGVLTEQLTSAGLDIVATDLNDAMVEVGRESVPAATWERADAMELPFDAESFDVVACQFGVMFLPDKQRGFAETRRVLAPGGTFVFNSWDTIDTHGWERVIQAALHDVFPENPPDFLRVLPHGYADPQRVVDDVRAGGFGDVSVETVTVDGTTPSVADLVTGYCTGTPVRAQLEARGDLPAITATMRERVVAELGPGPVTVSMSAHVVTARSPQAV